MLFLRPGPQDHSGPLLGGLMAGVSCELKHKVSPHGLEGHLRVARLIVEWSQLEGSCFLVDRSTTRC